MFKQFHWLIWVLIIFPNLVLIKLNVRTLSAKEIYGRCMFQPSYEFGVSARNIHIKETVPEEVIPCWYQRNKAEQQSYLCIFVLFFSGKRICTLYHHYYNLLSTTTFIVTLTSVSKLSSSPQIPRCLNSEVWESDRPSFTTSLPRASLLSFIKCEVCFKNTLKKRQENKIDTFVSVLLIHDYNQNF